MTKSHVKWPRLAIAWIGIGLSFAAVCFSETNWMIVPASLILIAAHWIALDSEWPRANQLLIGQGLLSLLGLIVFGVL